MNKDSEGTYPFVSIIIPMRNEEKFIARCLDSIFENDYPKERMEVIIVDGLSTDRSLEVIKNYERFSHLKVLQNPKKIRATANNIGIKAAQGEIIISMDAHVVYARDYVRRCVEMLQTTGAANVGGIQRAVGYSYITKSIAFATTTPFGIGNAEFRYLDKRKWVDTVYLGAWLKKTLEEVGLFNEDWIRNADYELNYRIRKAGGKILLSPEIKCEYVVRSSLLNLARQYYLYGKWRVKTMVIHPDSVRWRQLLPPLLILWLSLSLIFGMLGIKFWWLPAALYFTYTFLISACIAVRNGIYYFPMLVASLWTLQLSWGAGFFSGLFKFGFPRISLTRVIKDVFGKADF